jgi:hypothetical protein
MRNPVALLTFALAALLTVGSCAFAWYFLLQPMARAVEVAGELESGFREGLGVVPRISVDRGAIHPQESDEDEIGLSVAEGRIEADSGDGGAVAGVYRAEAGFYARDRFDVAVGAGGHIAECRLPHVKIIGITVSDIDGAGGSGLSPERLERILGNAVRRKLADEGFVDQARAALRARVEVIGAATGCEIVFAGDHGD